MVYGSIAGSILFLLWFCYWFYIIPGSVTYFSSIRHINPYCCHQ